MSDTKQPELFKKKFNQKYPKLNLEYLAFLQDQEKDRRSKDYPKKISDTREGTSEFLILVMCWNEYIKKHASLFQTIHSKQYKDIWIQTEKYHKLLDKES